MKYVFVLVLLLRGRRSRGVQGVAVVYRWNHNMIADPARDARAR